MTKVTKRNVEMFTIEGGNLTRDEALTLYRELAAALGCPAFRTSSCGDRLSHGAHWHGTHVDQYCGGRSFDAT